MKAERSFADARRASVCPMPARFGKVAIVDGGGVSKGGTCEAAHLDYALTNIADAATRSVRAVSGVS